MVKPTLLRAAAAEVADRSAPTNLPETGDLELVLDVQGKLLEGPVWDGRTNQLHFVDINNQQIHTFDPYAPADAPDRHTNMDMPEPVAFITLTAHPGELIAAMERSAVLVDLKTKSTVRTIATTPESHGTEGYRFNDGKPSPSGILVGGRKHESSEEPGGKRGRIYKLDWKPDPQQSEWVEIVGTEEVQLPNGMAWNLNSGEMYLNDSVYDGINPAAGVVWAYTVNEEGMPMRDADGKLQRRVVTTYSPDDGVPDGLTVDSQARIWLARAKGSAVLCIDAQTGQELHRIDMPVEMPTACAFGGKDLSDLYITTTCMGGGKGAGGLWRYRLPGLVGWHPAYPALQQTEWREQ
ncbi:hypothetical protein WJX72_009323 [[Myrmecia] bisecta]|uniref:SMP-30/Gluconolactonase/LRE-like region domain-containing protein n=1 Tax=[Myrmecia] bisecta TaxID=41462 RepID=A0AAW1Q1K3_9CHLO